MSYQLLLRPGTAPVRVGDGIVVSLDQIVASAILQMLPANSLGDGKGTEEYEINRKWSLLVTSASFLQTHIFIFI